MVFVLSLPTRECGLKSEKLRRYVGFKGHSLRGSVDWNVQIKWKMQILLSHSLRGSVDWNWRTRWLHDCDSRSLPTRPNYIAECLHTPHHSLTYHIPYMRFSSCGGGELCSGSFLLHTRMSSAEILHAIYSSDSIRYPFPDHIWSRRGCEFPEGLLYAGIVFYRNHQWEQYRH